MNGRTTLAATLLASLLTFGAAAQEATLYERVGGLPAITAAVDDAFEIAARDGRINHRFGAGGIVQLKKHLVDLLCLRTGGPCVYTGRDMSAAHDGMMISDAEFDALIEDLTTAIDKFKLPARERGELLAIANQFRGAIVGH